MSINNIYKYINDNSVDYFNKIKNNSFIDWKLSESF